MKGMKELLVLMTFFFLYNNNIFAAKSDQKIEPKPRFIPEYSCRALLVFLDDTRDSEGASALAFLEATSVEAGPILVSTSLIHSLFRSTRGANVLDNIARYYVYRLNDALCFLLPRTLLGDLCGTQELVILQTGREKWEIKQFPQAKDEKVTALELLLGLKLQHLDLIWPRNRIGHGIIKDIDSAKTFIHALEQGQIFCNRREYYKAGLKTIPLWTLYFVGHGDTRRRVAGMTHEQWAQCLDNLESNKVTRLLVYTSCFSVGTQSIEIYRNAQKAVAREYSFAIIGLAMGFNMPSAATDARGFSSFLQAAVEPDIDYYKIASTLVSGDLDWSGLKLPGIPWISFEKLNKKYGKSKERSPITTIGDVLSRTRTLPLTIKRRQQLGEEYIILYAQQVPFELIIEDQVKIVSMIPGRVEHCFKKISMRKMPLLSGLWGMFSQWPDKTFFIKTLQAADAVGEFVIINYENIFEYKSYSDYTPANIFYYKGESVYCIDKKTHTERIATRDEISLYIKLLADVAFADRVQQGGQLPLSVPENFFEKLRGTKSWDIKGEIDSFIQRLARTT